MVVVVVVVLMADPAERFRYCPVAPLYLAALIANMFQVPVVVVVVAVLVVAVKKIVWEGPGGSVGVRGGGVLRGCKCE